MPRYRPYTDKRDKVKCECDACHIENAINEDPQVKAMRVLLRTKSKTDRDDVAMIRHHIRVRKAELRNK